MSTFNLDIEQKVVVFDVETPNENNSRICSVGYTIVNGGKIVETQELLVNPECTFSPYSTKIHGITKGMVVNSPTFPELWTSLEPLFCENIVVGYNIASFDLSVLSKTLMAYNLPAPIVNYVDVFEIARDVFPYLKNYGLKDVANEIGFDFQHHKAGDDSLACAEILCHVMRQGINFSKYVKHYNLNREWENTETDSAWKPKISDASKALLDLKGILNSITEDGVIDENEFCLLTSWVSVHEELKGNYPYDTVYQSIVNILEDGIIEPCELEELLSVCEELLDPVNSGHFEEKRISIAGKTVVLSGEFVHGSKSEITAIIESMGGVIKGNVSKKTNIVLVGDCGNDAWVAGNYGTKIKKAMELQAEGVSIEIIKECDFFKAIGQ